MKGVLFDLDGVLIDTETLYTEFWGDMDRRFPTGVEDFAYVIKGNNLARIFGTYFPDESIQKQILVLLNEFERTMQYRIFPGVLNFLDELKAAKIPFAVVTSSDIEKMEKLYLQLPGFKERFDAIITGNMVGKGKPNPECFIKGAEAIGCELKDCYIFEDSPSGLEAALATGAKVIALATTLRRKDINKEADKILDSFIDFHVSDMLAI